MPRFQNDGWLKQIAAGGSGAHRINGATINGGYIEKSHFFAAHQALPSKYWQDGSIRWILNPTLWGVYIEYITNRATPAGDAALLGQAGTPLNIPAVFVPSMPTSRILLGVPQNFIAVNTYDIRNRKTTEGREAIRQDKRFYATFLNDDPIIETMDAIADVYGVVAAIHP